jgi:hypothetical protein
MVVLAWGLLIGAAAAAGVWGLHRIEDHLLGPDQAGQVENVHIRLPHRPVWLPVAVARRIATDCATSEVGFYDRDLLRIIHDKALASPWVRCVWSVRKRLSADGRVGTIEVDCEYRKPIARVSLDYSSGRGTVPVIFVDADGVRLPTRQAPTIVAEWMDQDEAPIIRTYADGRSAPGDAHCYQVHYPLITTLLRAAPATGEAFDDAALFDGLQLASLVAEQPYGDQITVIDVRNHRGRINPSDPHLTMTAQIGRGQRTEILFGRFPRPGGVDVVVPTERKLTYLSDYAGKHDGRLAGFHSELDLQYDHYATRPY